MDNRSIIAGVVAIKVALLAGAVYAIVNEMWILLAVLTILRFGTSVLLGGILAQYWRDWVSSLVDDGDRAVEDASIHKLSGGLSTPENDSITEDGDTRTRADKSPIFGRDGANGNRRRRR